MNRFSAQIVDKARRLAREGLTYVKIGQELNVSNANISIWCRETPIKNQRPLIKSIQDKRNQIKQTDINNLNKIHFDKYVMKLVCAIIYGCEGAKYPASNCIALTNSDPYLMSAFMRMFRASFDLDETKFHASLQIHSNQNYKKLLNFWGKILKIPADNFYKPTITNPGGKKHRDFYQGTCTIKYYDYRLQLRLIGIYEQCMRKFALLEGMPNG